MSTNWFRIALTQAIAIGTLSAMAQQPPPVVGPNLPDTGPNRVEVRFAIGTLPVLCKSFQITAIAGGQTLLAESFASGFSIPPAAAANHDTVDLRLQCGEHTWHFSDVPHRVFLQGWWWVGTDYPPFQERLQGSPLFKDALWIRYLIVEPTKDESGFNVVKWCPARFKHKKPGPCFTD